MVFLVERWAINTLAIPVLIMGASGSGKTYSMHTLPNDSYGLIECQKTMLSFAGGKKFGRTKDFKTLEAMIEKYIEKGAKLIVIDDFGYCITDLYIRHSYGKEKYRDQFEIYKEIGATTYHFIDFLNNVGTDDTFIYLTMHTDTNDLGDIIPSTIGKLLNEKVNLLGMFNLVVLSQNKGGEYNFIVGGQAPAKTCGAFEQDVLPNDMLTLDTGFRKFIGAKPIGE